MTISGLTPVETWSPIIWNGTTSQFEPASKPQNPAADTYYDVVGSGEDANGDFIFAGDKLVCTAGGTTPSWKIIRGDYDRFNALPFGIDNTGSRNTQPEIQNAVNAIDAIGGGTLYLPAGTYTVAASIEVPVSVSLCGASAVQKDADGNQTGTFIRPIGDPNESAPGEFDNFETINVDGSSQKFVFLLNVSGGNTGDWVKSFPNTRTTVERLIMDFSANTGVKSGFWFAGTYAFREIRAIDVATLIGRPNLYVDGVEIFDIFVKSRVKAAPWLIYLPGFGDGLTIDYVSPGYSYSSDGSVKSASKNIYLGNCHGGSISNIVNGIDLIEGADAVKYSNAHKENGWLEIDFADVNVENCYFTVGTGADDAPVTPIILKNENLTLGTSCRVSVKDCTFMHILGSAGGGVAGWSGQETLDIDLRSGGVQLVMNGGNRRVASFDGYLSKRFTHAPLVGDSTDGGIFQNWLNYSPMLAAKDSAILNKTVAVSGWIPDRNFPWSGLFPAPLEYDGTAWPYTGNVFYFARPLYDPERKIGRAAQPMAGGASEVEVVMNSAKLPGFKVSTDNPATQGAVLWEVYRGTSSNSYTHRALVPGIDLEYFVDSGLAINGFAWEEYDADGAAPIPINSNGYSGASEYVDGILRILDSSIANVPTEGAWQQGDVIGTPYKEPDGTGVKLCSRTFRITGGQGFWDAQYINT